MKDLVFLPIYKLTVILKDNKSIITEHQTEEEAFEKLNEYYSAKKIKGYTIETIN